MTFGKFTSLPSLMIFAWILSETKPLIIVSLSTLFHVSPSGYSASLINLKCFGMEVFQTHGTLEVSWVPQPQLRHLIWVQYVLQRVQNTCLSDSCCHHESFPQFPIYQWVPFCCVTMVYASQLQQVEVSGHGYLTVYQWESALLTMSPSNCSDPVHLLLGYTRITS